MASGQRGAPHGAAVLTKAMGRAAAALGLHQRSTAKIIGVSEATMSRIFTGKATLDPDAKEGELALLLVRMFRSLDALMGGSEAKVRAWLLATNAHLGGVPAERIQTVEGLVHVTQYLDAMRGKL